MRLLQLSPLEHRFSDISKKQCDTSLRSGRHLIAGASPEQALRITREADPARCIAHGVRLLAGGHRSSAPPTLRDSLSLIENMTELELSVNTLAGGHVSARNRRRGRGTPRLPCPIHSGKEAGQQRTSPMSRPHLHFPSHSPEWKNPPEGSAAAARPDLLRNGLHTPRTSSRRAESRLPSLAGSHHRRGEKGGLATQLPTRRPLQTQQT